MYAHHVPYFHFTMESTSSMTFPNEAVNPKELGMVTILSTTLI